MGFLPAAALFGGHSAVSVVLALVTLDGAAPLAIRTEGFRAGPLWKHFAARGIAFAGLVAGIFFAPRTEDHRPQPRDWAVVIAGTTALIWMILAGWLESQ